MSFEYAYTVHEPALWANIAGGHAMQPPLANERGSWEMVRAEFVKVSECTSHTVNKMAEYNNSKTDASSSSFTHKMVVFWRRWVGPKRDQDAEALRAAAIY